MNGLTTAKFNNFLVYSLAFLFCLTIASYYLAANGKINNFPNYLSFIFLLITAIVDFSKIKAVINPSTSALLIIATLFLLYMSSTTLWSRNASASNFLLHIGYSILLLSFILSYLVCHSQLSIFKNWTLPMLVLCATISASYSIYLFYGLEDYHPLDEERLYALGRLRNPVVGALSYGTAAVLAAFYISSRSDLSEKALWGLCLVVLIYAIWLTGTRGVWAALAAVAVIYVVTSERITPGKKIGGMLILLILSGSIVTTIYFLDWESFLGHRSLSFRPEIWKASIEKVWAYNLWFGLGVNANSELTHDELTFQHSHSIYIATLFYGGLVGLSLLTGLVMTTFRHLYLSENSPERDLALGTWIFGLTAFAIDGDRLLEKIDFHWIVFWLPLTLVIALGHNLTKDREGF